MPSRVFAVVCLAAAIAAAQQKPAAKPAAAPATAACVVKPNPTYDAEIRKNTTLPNFSTEFVDHLPVSSCVDAPDKFFGHIVGAPDVLEYSERLNDYLRHMESQSKRVKVFSMGRSEEGHEMVIAAISDEDTIAHIDHYRDITARLADPRGLSAADAEALIEQGKPMYWASGSIHSTETGSPEMLMELAYRIAVEDTPFIQNIRKHAIILITPAAETDGRDREVDLYMHRKKDPNAVTPSLIWWGDYVNHDNNRDGLTLGLALSRNMTGTFLQWHPQVLHDLHESEPFLYISTGTGPYNPWLDPMEIDEWQSMAYYEIDQLTKRDVIGVWTHGFFDGWAPNYMLYAAIGHNAVGRFYETQGNGGADTRMVTNTDISKQWFRPNPALPSVMWSARDNTNMQESGLLLGMSNMATNAQEFLRDFYLKSKRSVAKATTEGPAAWVFPGDDPRTGAQARLLNQLQLQGVEIHRADAEFTANGKKYPAGSYIVRLDQPYSREADMLLDQEFYNPSDPSPYDDTGWTMGALADVQTVKVADVAILKTPMTKVSGMVAAPGGLSGTGTTYVINANADPNLATFRYAVPKIPMDVTERAFDAGGKHFNAGSVIIRNADTAALAPAAKSAGVQLVAVSDPITVATHALQAPRIAIVHNWQSPVEDGWARISFEQLKIPYTYVADTKIRVTPNLRDQFDVILMMPIGNSVISMMSGVGGASPIAWQNTPDMPHLSPPGLDSTDDIRGGLGYSGFQNLEQFVNQGGLLIAVGSSVQLATDLGFASGVTTRTAPTGADGLNARGAVLHAEFADLSSPVAYGFGGGPIGIYYSNGLLLSAGGAGGRGAFGGGGGAAGGRGRGGATRPSGIGSPSSPDVIQARPPAAQLAEASRGPAGEGNAEDQAAGGRGAGGGGGRGGRGGGAATAPPRVILNFSPAADLLVSGLLTGGDNIAGQPVAISAQHGQGFYLLFDANPMYRNETLAEFGMVFNAALNYKNLDAGAAAAPAAGGGRGRRGGQ